MFISLLKMLGIVTMGAEDTTIQDNPVMSSLLLGVVGVGIVLMASHVLFSWLF